MDPCSLQCRGAAIEREACAFLRLPSGLRAGVRMRERVEFAGHAGAASKRRREMQAKPLLAFLSRGAMRTSRSPRAQRVGRRTGRIANTMPCTRAAIRLSGVKKRLQRSRGSNDCGDAGFRVTRAEPTAHSSRRANPRPRLSAARKRERHCTLPVFPRARGKWLAAQAARIRVQRLPQRQPRHTHRPC